MPTHTKKGSFGVSSLNYRFLGLVLISCALQSRGKQYQMLTGQSAVKKIVGNVTYMLVTFSLTDW